MSVAQKQNTLNTRLAKIDTAPTKHMHEHKTWKLKTNMVPKKFSGSDWMETNPVSFRRIKQKSGFISRQNNKIQINGIL